MSKQSKHNGRTPAEKAQKVLQDPLERQAQRAREAAEEKEWAERSGPVTVRQACPACTGKVKGVHHSSDCQEVGS